MTYIKDFHDFPTEDPPVVTEYLDKRTKETVRKAIDEIVEDEFCRLGEYAADYVSGLATERCKRFIEKLLAGDDDAALELFGSRDNGDRYRPEGMNDKGKPWSRLTNGTLFETGGIATRRKLVEAFPELLRDERVKDLESVVDGLSRQVIELQQQLDSAYRRMG